MSTEAWTALTAADNTPTMCALRRTLGLMVENVNAAHEDLGSAVGCMERARVHAARVQENGIGVWACRGPFAALSMVSGLVARTDATTAAGHGEELAQLCWRADTISACLSPYADDLACEGFRGAYGALDRKLKESDGR